MNVSSDDVEWSSFSTVVISLYRRFFLLRTVGIDIAGVSVRYTQGRAMGDSHSSALVVHVVSCSEEEGCTHTLVLWGGVGVMSASLFL